MANMTTFSLDSNFVNEYASKKTSFGFNGLGELVYLRSYSREMTDNRREQWHNTVERVVNGTFRMQQEWAAKSLLPYDPVAAQTRAQQMFERMFTMKFLPPGRGLWAMGSELTEKRKQYAALNNCAFVSTDISTCSLGDTIGGAGVDVCKPYCFLMDASMLGVGVGFDTKGANSVFVRGVLPSTDESMYIIPDSREGWVESVRLLLSAFLVPVKNNSTGTDLALSLYTAVALPRFDYSLIRPAGAKIRGFGGTSQGPAILKELHASLTGLLSESDQRSSPLTSTTIVDIMNLIGKCVVAGNVRRTAEIAFGSPDDQEYAALKDYTANPHRAAFGWTSNNSVYASLGMDYRGLCERHVSQNGEPGFAWLENMQAYSRMEGPRDYIDSKAQGGNPCLEQTLESFEVCCLVETFPQRHESIEDYCQTLAVAMEYAKTVTLGATHWPETNAVMLRNRRIGCSMSGVAQFIAARGHGVLKEWCESGYAAVREADSQLSDRFCVPRSIKVTSIKPSGTVSLLAGATPGAHFPESRFYLRRVRLPMESALVTALRTRGYRLEPDVTAPFDTAVVEIPVDLHESMNLNLNHDEARTGETTTVRGPVKTLDDVSCWEQLALAAFLQRYWADNQVSCTVTFDPQLEGEQLSAALDYYQFQLKGVSFLPRANHKLRCRMLGAGAGAGAGAESGYLQMPYEPISAGVFEQYALELRKRQSESNLSLSALYCTASTAVGGKIVDGEVIAVPDQFCDSTSCERIV